MKDVGPCLKCGGAMEVGFIRDSSHRHKTQAVWVPGMPEAGLLPGSIITRGRGVPIFTYRCTSCGFLESYVFSRETG